MPAVRTNILARKLKTRKLESDTGSLACLDIVDDLGETAPVLQGLSLLEHAVKVEGTRDPIHNTSLLNLLLTARK